MLVHGPSYNLTLTLSQLRIILGEFEPAPQVSKPVGHGLTVTRVEINRTMVV
jgi:hypothetical protein